MLLKRAYTRHELEEFLDQTRFGPNEIREDLIGLELMLHKTIAGDPNRDIVLDLCRRLEHFRNWCRLIYRSITVAAPFRAACVSMRHSTVNQKLL